MLLIKDLQQISYQEALAKMQAFTQNRTATTPDEIWLCEHMPVFTLGRHADPEHLLNPHEIPVIQSDRGGQVTYHGPGQLVVYCLVDLKRKKMGIKDLVCRLETAVIETLKAFGIEAKRRANMPGVYVDDAKICSLGLRIKEGKSYHGLALNINMDLTPFTYIHPCGYEHLAVTQLSAWAPNIKHEAVAAKLTQCLLSALA